MPNEAEMRAQIVRYGALLYERRLAHGSAGNLSVRLEDGSIIVTPTNYCLGFLDPDRLSKVSANGQHLAGDPASKEAFFHLAIYQARPEAHAIVHLHSTYSTAVSCLCHDSPTSVLPPLTAYQIMRVGELPLLPYYRPGDHRLAQAVRIAAKDYRAMLLANHGPIVSGKSLQDAVYSYEELEETVKLYFLLGDRKVSLLTADDIVELTTIFPS